LLAELDGACDRLECEKVRDLLLDVIAGYVPQCGIKDHLWLAEHNMQDAIHGHQPRAKRAAEMPALRVVE